VIEEQRTVEEEGKNEEKAMEKRKLKTRGEDKV
jgi:hypothetical protein